MSQELLPLAEKKGIAIQYKKKKIKAVFDYPWTLVALSNILENAIKYSKPNSMVKVLSLIHIFLILHCGSMTLRLERGKVRAILAEDAGS